MLEITDRACELLVQLIREADVSTDVVPRILHKEKGFSIHLDRAASNDDLFTHDGRVVLVLDTETARALADRTLDVRDADGGAALALR